MSKARTLVGGNPNDEGDMPPLFKPGEFGGAGQVERRYDGNDGPFTYEEFQGEYGVDAPARWAEATPAGQEQNWGQGQGYQGQGQGQYGEGYYAGQGYDHTGY